MAEKSISIKLGMDNAEFIKEMKKADREIKSTEKTAQNLAKSLDIEFNANTAVQAQKQYQSALEQTEAKATRLREEMAKVAASSGVDSENYSKLQLELAKTEAKAVTLKDKLEEVKNIKIEQLTEKVETLGNKITGAGQKLSVFSVAAAGAIAGAAAIGKQAAATGADIDDMTQRFDISAETVQRWNYIAMQSGVEATTFTNALVKARAAMSDLASGNANAASETLQNLGISARQFGSDEEMFNGIVKALRNVEDSALQTAYANEIFGNKIATQLLPYINAGAEDLAKWNAEFDAMPSLTGEEAASLAELDDTFNRLSVTMQYATAQLGEAFAPIIERVIEFIENTVVPALESFGEWFDSLGEPMQNTILGMAGIIAVAGPLLIVLGKGVSALKNIFPLLDLMDTKIGRATIGFAAFSAAVGLVLGLIQNWSKMDGWAKAIAIIGTVTAAALGAAVAFGAFHSAWSLGLAVTGIIAGITAAVAAINSAKKEIEVPDDIPDYNADKVASGVMSGNGNTSDYTSDDGLDAIMNGDYRLPNYSASEGATYYDNSTYDYKPNINVYVTKPNATAEEIAAAVGKEIATLAQSRR